MRSATTEYDVFLELRADRDFTLLLVQVGDRPGHRREDDRLGQRVVRLFERRFRLRDLIERRFITGYLDLVGSLIGVEHGLRLELTCHHVARAIVVFLGFQHVLLYEFRLGLGRPNVGLGPLDRCLVALAIEFYEQLAFLDPVAFLDVQRHDLGADVGADTHLRLRLYTPCGIDLLDDCLEGDDGRLHLDHLLIAIGENPRSANSNDSHSPNDPPSFLLHFGPI